MTGLGFDCAPCFAMVRCPVLYRRNGGKEAF
jgi:hypothetical protein